MIYLDYAASTPLDPEVTKAMASLADIDGSYANASSNHAAGRRARALVDKATEQLAALLGCKPGELVWTSGATESDNLAIAGAARFRQDRGKHLVTMPIEHKAVTDVFHELEKQGFEVTWLHPDASGKVSLDDVEGALREDTQLVSIMHVNNETGVIQDVAAIGEICRRHDVLFHVDAAQSVGKVPIDLASMPIDLLSTTAHKIYGPNGIGALYIADRPGCHVEPPIFGGGQQRSIRPGTFAVPLIVGFGKAAEVAASRIDEDRKHLAKGHNDFVSEADREAEAAVIETIHKHYPDHAIFAEESGATGESDTVWIIDPLDGTTNFLHGFPIFCVSIGVQVKGRVEHGVVYDPTRQELFTASRGVGAQLDGRRIRVSGQSQMERALIGTGFPFRKADMEMGPYLEMLGKIVRNTSGVRRPGAAALDLCYVAAGRLDGFWETGLSAWDLAAGGLIIREAGGIVSGLDGSENYLETGHILTGTPKIYAGLAKLCATEIKAVLA